MKLRKKLDSMKPENSKLIIHSFLLPIMTTMTQLFWTTNHIPEEFRHKVSSKANLP